MSTSPRDQSALLWNAQAPTQTLRKPNEPLWILVKGGERWAAELRGHGEFGWEIQFLRNEEFWYGHRYALRRLAIAEGDAFRRELEANGWTNGQGMTIDYIRDDDRHLVIVRVRGAFDANAWFEGVVDRHNREHVWTYGILYDLRHVTSELTMTDVKDFLAESLRIPSALTQGPIATVVTDQANYAKACSSATLARSVLTVDVFTNLADAESWLVSHITRS
jgi:hypothetical protein